MTIDDFDVNEISDKLSIRDEADDNRVLEAAHNDAHNDFYGTHHDITSSTWHDDVSGPYPVHDDGHYDIFDDAPFGDAPFSDACPGYKQCPE